MQINVINRLTFNMTKEEKMEDNTLNQNEASELERLELERSSVISDMVDYATRDIDCKDYKYGCTLNMLLYHIGRCIDSCGISDVIKPDMINMSSVFEGLISDNYITKNPDSWRKYDFLVTAKGRKIGISKIKKKDGLIKILLSMAAVDVVIRNIRNGRYMNWERSACK